jgi:uncharacterized protein with PIN domain
MDTPARFVTDSSLDQLARRLRFLGYDVVTHAGARLEELFREAERSGRTVLTLSERLPPRRMPVPVVRVARGDLEGAIRAVTAIHAPATARWSRCPACNTALRSRTSFEAQGEVPGRVTRMRVPLSSCPQCGRWFWPGSHVARLTSWFARVLGEPDGPADPPTGGVAGPRPGPDRGSG